MVGIMFFDIKRDLVGLLSAVTMTFAVRAAVDIRPPDDKPDDVEAYLIMAEPGGELYSCAGHAALRLKCDANKRDLCYSYESESVRERVLTFLSGRLKMGMFSVPTEKYLSLYRDDKRGVRQYRLNLPTEVKRRLCKVADDRAKEGISLPYDFIARGCAQSVLKILTAAIKPLSLDIGTWPEKYEKKTRKELFYDSLGDFPWNRFFVLMLVGTEGDREVCKSQRVVIPTDLLVLLQRAKVAGVPIITGEGEQIVSGKQVEPASWLTPCAIGVILCVFSLLGWASGYGAVCRAILYFVYVVFAVFYTYLVFISNLPATSWHWLVIPFNVLPVLCWKWREKWRLSFAGLLVAWMAGMLIYPHRLIDPSCYWLVLAYALLAVGRATG